MINEVNEPPSVKTNHSLIQDEPYTQKPLTLKLNSNVKQKGPCLYNQIVRCCLLYIFVEKNRNATKHDRIEVPK